MRANAVVVATEDVNINNILVVECIFSIIFECTTKFSTVNVDYV